MLNFDEMPVGTIYYSVSEEQWCAAGADCATFEDAREAALQAGDVRGRIYIDKMTKGPNGSGGGPVFAGYKCELQAGLRIPVQSAVSSKNSARQAG